MSGAVVVEAPGVEALDLVAVAAAPTCDVCGALATCRLLTGDVAGSDIPTCDACASASEAAAAEDALAGAPVLAVRRLSLTEAELQAAEDAAFAEATRETITRAEAERRGWTLSTAGRLDGDAAACWYPETPVAWPPDAPEAWRIVEAAE